MKNKIVIGIINNLYGIISYLIPKKKNYFVFLPLHNKKKFSGNIRAFILYAHNNYPSLEIALVSRCQRVVREAKKENIRVINRPIYMFWAVFRAQYLIIDRNSVLFRKGKFSLIQLWHGVGFKNVGLMNENFNLTEKEAEKHFQKYDLVVATSEADVKKSEDSFGVETCVITGLPRNDLFFKKEREIKTIKEKFQLYKYSRIITYAPTFRDEETSKPFSSNFWKALDSHLKTTNSIFLVKKHPWDKILFIPDYYSNIRDVSVEIEDVQELLLVTDLLISDYSSIITDFALTNKPILIYNYDFEEYQENCRSIYYNLEETLPRPFVKEEEDLLNKIQDLSWFETKKIQNSYDKFKNKFHLFEDGNSCKRVMEAILELE